MRRYLWITACTGAAMLSACTALRQPPAPSAALHAGAPSRPGPLRIAQAASGTGFKPRRPAVFVLCRDDTCPRVTPKTLARAVPAGNGDDTRSPDPGQGTLLSSPQVASSTERATVPAARNGDAAATPPESVLPSGPDARPRAAEQPLPSDIALTVRFRFGEARLTDAAKALLDAGARQASAAGPYSRLRIVGRTDSVGPRAVNDALAMARARAVRDHLRGRLAHWPPAVDIEAAGGCCYAAGNDSAEGRDANRRVEVTLSPSDPEASP
ncbi:MAG: OmpA family protein [Acidovorax sp.]